MNNQEVIFSNIMDDWAFDNMLKNLKKEAMLLINVM